MDKEKEVLKIKDKGEYLKELREMTEISLAHLSKDDYEEGLKLLKEFFGEFFNIPNEFTFGELREKVLESNVHEKIKEQIINLTNSLDNSLYTKDFSYEKDFEKIKEEFVAIIRDLIPLSSETKSTKKITFSFLKLFHANKNQKSLFSKKPNIAYNTSSYERKYPIGPQEEKEYPNKSPTRLKWGTTPGFQQNLVNTDLKEEEISNTIQKNEQPKVNLKESNKDTISEQTKKIIQEKPNLKFNDEQKKEIESNHIINHKIVQDKNLQEKINKISSQFENLKIKGVNNPFLELEFKSLIGDYKLYQLNKNPEKEEIISIKLNKFKSRLEKT